MVTRQHLLQALNEALEPPAGMSDASNNGLQVEGTERIDRLVFGVDACAQLFQQAAAWNAQAVVVHHGISWGPGFVTVTGMDSRRIGMLLAREISLFAYHLPLDCHPQLGNNAQLARLLDLADLRPFGTYGGIDIGFRGRLTRTTPLRDLVERVNHTLGVTSDVVAVDPEHPVTTLGVISGGGADMISQCPQHGVDCLLTGEITHQHIHPAREYRVPVIAAGHYATETCGLKALMTRLQKDLPVECRFIDLPTGY